MGTLLLFVIIIIVVFYIYKNFYFIKVDNTLMFTGAPGTGKTNEMVRMSLKLLKAVRRKAKRTNFKYFFYNMWYRKDKDWIPLPCLLYTSPSPRDRTRSRMPSSA